MFGNVSETVDMAMLGKNVVYGVSVFVSNINFVFWIDTKNLEALDVASDRCC